MYGEALPFAMTTSTLPKLSADALTQSKIASFEATSTLVPTARAGLSAGRVSWKVTYSLLVTERAQ